MKTKTIITNTNSKLIFILKKNWKNTAMIEMFISNK